MLYPTFEAYYLGSAVPLASAEEDTIDLPELICPLLDFVGAAKKGGRAKDWFTEGNGGRVTELVKEVIRWGQMSEEDVRSKLICPV